MLLVGVDGGGTHTRALAVQTDGTVVGCGRSGPSNQQVVGVDGAAAAVRAAVLEAAAGRRPDAVGACLAGVDLPEHGDLLQAALGEVLATRVHVENDIAAALWAVPGDAVGVVASGTGAAVALRQDGVARRLLALNEYTGPQGGAGDIATLALREAILSAQGAAPPTRLTERILGLFGLPDHVALARATETGAMPPWQVALLVAPLCAELAVEGDAGARAVLRTAGRELGRVEGRYFEAQGLRPAAPVACYGALLRGGPQVYRSAFHRALRREFEAGREPRATLDAVAGAVLFAAAREEAALPSLTAVLVRLGAGACS
jgi:N-acetylglucosamine kinase-like BadF-type ATPase